MEPSQTIKHFSSKITLDDYDVNEIKEYIKESLPEYKWHLNNEETYNTMVST